MPKLIKLSRKAQAQLRRDPRMKELYYNYKINGGFNCVEEIIFNQLVAEATAGEL